jgi:hypothetical protein
MRRLLALACLLGLGACQFKKEPTCISSDLACAGGCIYYDPATCTCEPGDCNPDLGAAPHAKACGDIFQCVFGGTGKTATQCAAGHPYVASTTYDAVIECVYNACGNQTSDAGSDMPCNGSLTDMGIASCNTCFLDSLTGGEMKWQLPGGSDNMCTTATDKWCGACVAQLSSCLNQCFTDADCAGFTTPLTCMGASGATPGTCG